MTPSPQGQRAEARAKFFRLRDAATSRAMNNQLKPWDLAILMAAQHRHGLKLHGRLP